MVDTNEATTGSLILVIEERAASLFTTDDLGRAVTTHEDIRRAVEEERGRPRLHVLPGSDAGRIG